jgi:hypothetical protein
MRASLSLVCIPLLSLLSFIWIMGCESGSGNSLNNLPLARGASGEVLLVMDSASWRGELGDELRETFTKAMPGLPRPEPLFSVHYVNPFKLNKVLLNAKNMIFVATLDNKSRSGMKMRSYFTESSIKKIQDDSSLFQFSQENQFAKGQELLFLFGISDEALIENIKNNREEIRRHFHEIELERIQAKLYKVKEQKPVSDKILKEDGFYIRVPFGYKAVPMDSAEHFVWIRSLENEVDKSVFVAYKDYISEDAFLPENILKFRAQTTRYNLADDSSTYMSIQEEAPVIFDTVNFNGKYAIEMRGRWRLSDVVMGGPFLSYTFVDEATNRLYYIEGFVYSPNKQQRPFIREMETILKTFRTYE